MKSSLLGFMGACAFAVFVTPAIAVTLDYSNISGSELVFNPLDDCGGIGTVGCFEFLPWLPPPSTNPPNLQITSSTTGSASGLFGTISGTFGVGPITGTGFIPTVETATVSGTGTLTIYDGPNPVLTAVLTLENIFTFQAGGGINFAGATNLSSIAYGGTNADLLALANANGGNGLQTVSFQFDVPTSLHDLFDGTEETPTSFSGSISAVPIPAAVWLFGSGLLGLLGISRKMKAT